MQNKLTWSNGVIYLEGEPIGATQLAKSHIYSYILGKTNIQFELTEKKKSTIQNKNNEIGGTLAQEKKGRKVTITLQDGTEYIMYKPSMWKKKWNLLAYGNTMMDFSYSTSEGEINYLYRNELLILIGLYIIHEN